MRSMKFRGKPGQLPATFLSGLPVPAPFCLTSVHSRSNPVRTLRNPVTSVARHQIPHQFPPRISNLLKGLNGFLRDPAGSASRFFESDSNTEHSVRNPQVSFRFLRQIETPNAFFYAARCSARTSIRILGRTGTNGGDLISCDETARGASSSAVHPEPNSILPLTADAPDFPEVLRFS